MKKKFLFFLLIASANNLFAQTSNVDSLKIALANSKLDTSRVLLLATMSEQYEMIKLDTALVLAKQGYALAKQIDFVRGEAICLNTIGRMLMRRDNFSKGLQTELESLLIFEKLKDLKGMAVVYNDIGNIYERLGDHQQALDNFIRSRGYAIEINDPILIMRIVSSIGYNYYKLDKLDSAFKYAQQSYDIALAKGIKTGRLPWEIGLLGGIQDKMGNTTIALAYYHEAISKAKATKQQAFFPYVYQVMSMLYKRTNRLDSALFYGEKAYEASKKVNFTNGVVDASALLADLYSGRDNDKAVTYFKISSQMRDTLFSQEKIRQVQNVTYNEDLRQQELERQRQQASEERKNNIQYAAITIGLIGFIILFLLLSHSVIVNEKVIKFFGVIGLLVVFEFINLLLHPFLGGVTHHSPFLMLIAMVMIAILLVPAHHYLEKSITEKMVEKNKKIRLAAAKKTIEKLGANP